MANESEKHVLLSYSHESKAIVEMVGKKLREENFDVCFHYREPNERTHDELMKAVENAYIVCCFLTADYETSPYCKLELEYAKKLNKHIASCFVVDEHQWEPTKGKWLDLVIGSTQSFDFSSSSEEVRMQELQELIFKIGHDSLDSQENLPKLKDTLVIALKHQYLRRGQIKRTYNETRSFAMEESYINLSMVPTKHEAREEMQVRENQSSVNIGEILKLCKNKRKRIVLHGPAGIGKSTFCEYATYLWAKGDLWSEYDLVILIDPHELTKERYPTEGSYVLEYLIEHEYFDRDRLPLDKGSALRQMCKDQNVLWILDGYERFTRHAAESTKHAFNEIIDTQHFLLTSRLCPINLSYETSIEMIGFVDRGMENYIEQYFHESPDEIPKLLNCMKLNPSVWTIGHTPANLELLCIMWTDANWSNKPDMTITNLHEHFVSFLCKQYLKEANIDFDFNDEQKIAEHCDKELRFLENLALAAMESSSFIIQSELMQKVAKDCQYDFFSNSQLWKLGILKSHINHRSAYYFIHPSFQEYFAARYLDRQLTTDEQSAIKLINSYKYDQRFTKLFVFTTGISVSRSDLQKLDLFVKTIESQPADLIGMRHIQLMIQLYDELEPCRNYQNLDKHLHHIQNWFQFAMKQTNKSIQSNVLNMIANSATLSQKMQHQEIASQTQDTDGVEFDRTIVQQLTDSKWFQRRNAGETLVRMGEKAATKETLLELMNLFQNPEKDVRNVACYTLIKISDKVATDDLISTFLLALQHSEWLVKKTVCSAIRQIAGRLITNDIINLLIMLLKDSDERVQHAACQTLVSIGNKAANNETIGMLTELLQNGQWSVKEAACTVLMEMGDHIGTIEIIDALITIVCHEKGILRITASRALGNIYQNRINYYLVNQLVQTMRHAQHGARRAACQVFANIGPKVATKTVIEALLQALADEQWNVRVAACETFKAFGDKVAIDQVVKALIPLLVDEKDEVQKAAYATLMNMPPKIATQSNVDAITEMMYYHGIGSTAQRALTGMFYKAIAISKLEIIHEALRSENDNVTYAVCEALKHAESNAATADAIEALIRILQRSETRCTWIALEALARMCSIARPTRERPISYMYVARREPHYGLIIDALEEIFKHHEMLRSHYMDNVINMALEHSDYDLRYNVCKYIIHTGYDKTNERTVLLLLEIFKNSRNRMKQIALEALKVIRYYRPTNQVIDFIVELLKDSDEHNNRAAFQIIINANEQVATKEIIDVVNIILRDGQFWQREYACKALAAMGNKAATEDIICALNQAVRDSDVRVSKAACQALAAMSNEKATEATIDTFLYVLRLPKCNFKISALQGLTAMGVKGVSKNTIDAIIEAIQNSDEEFMREACKVLIATGDKTTTKTRIDILIQKCKDPNYGVKTCAGEILVELADKKVLNDFRDVFIEDMQNHDKSVKRVAFKVLTKMDYKSVVTSIINAAIEASQESDEDIKISAYELLAIMAEKEVTTELINQLLRAYCNPEWKIKSISQRAFKKLGKIETRGDTINIIMRALNSSEEAMKQAACEALTEMGHNTAVKHVIDVPIETLQHSDVSVRRAAWQALAKIEDWSVRDDAMEIAMQAIQDKDHYVNEVACQILAQMGAKAANKDTMDTVMDLVIKFPYFITRAACNTLLTIWTHMPMEDALNVLMSVLQGSNHKVKSTAIKALKAVINCPMDKELIDLLIKMLFSGKDHTLYSWEDDVNKAAVEVFVGLDENMVTIDIINALIDALQNSNERVKRFIRDALTGIYEKTTNQHIIYAILHGLRTLDKEVRHLVYDLLSWNFNKIATNGAIDAIVEIFRDSDEKIRRIMRTTFLRMKMPVTTKDFMDSIIKVFRDPDQDVRQLAYERLLNMNQEMVTRDLVDMLIKTMQHADWPVRQAVAEIFARWKFVKFDSDQITNLLSPTGQVNETSLRVLLMSESLGTNMSDHHIVELKNGVLSKPFFGYENISADKLMKIWLADSRNEWIPLLVHSALVQSTAIVPMEKDLILYNVYNETIRQSMDEQKLSCFLQSVRQYLMEMDLCIANLNWSDTPLTLSSQEKENMKTPN